LFLPGLNADDAVVATAEADVVATEVAVEDTVDFLNAEGAEDAEDADDAGDAEAGVVGLSYKSYQAYVSAMVQMWNTQISLGLHNNPNPNGAALKSYMDTIKRGTVRRKRENFADRGKDTLADGYTPEDMLKLHMWYMSKGTGNQLRNRADFLVAHAMLMRGESRRMLQVWNPRMIMKDT
jgi:hypothetical protein